jgi:hypothetical protein
MDVVPQLDPKFSNTRWSKSSQGRLRTFPDAKGRRVWTNILPLVHTNGSVKKLILFLLGRALLQSSRNKFSIAWLEIFRPAQDVVIYGGPQQSLWRPRHHVMRFMKTSNFALPKSTSTAQPQLPSSFSWRRNQGKQGVKNYDQPDP